MSGVIARALPALIAAALAFGTASATASASGEWRVENVFPLNPYLVPGFSEQATAAVYRLLDPEGNQIGPIVRRAPLDFLDWVEVPPTPGIYTIEGWLEDGNGPLGPPGTATLRFDNAPPSPAEPEGPARWLLGTEPAVLKIGHPAPPFPLSDIRGYAVSLDRGSGSDPCSNPTWCSPAETDLSGGIGDDTISLGTLPEGTTFARVAAVSGAGVASTVATTPIKVDATRPVVALQGVPPGWSAGPVRVTAFASDRLSGMAAAGAGGPLTTIAVDGGAATTTQGASATAWIAGGGIHRVEFYARDAAGNLSGGDPNGPPPATAAVRIDEESPQVHFASAQDPADPERIEATVSDGLSGVDPSRGSIKVRLAGTQAEFEELPTKVVEGNLVAYWDSDSYPPGKYEFIAVGFDQAGNSGTGTSRKRGGRMVLVNPLKAPVALLAGFASGKHEDLEQRSWVGYGQRPRFGGRLHLLGGTSVAGAAVAVTETFVRGSRLRQRTTLVRSRADGTFSLRLAPGPSREVVASFAGSKVLSRAASDGATVSVKTAVRLRTSAPTAKVNGHPIVFSGRVVGLGAEGSGGLPIELQFRYPGTGWSEFRTLEADAHGRFRYAYRFSDDDSRGIRFQFRAYVPGREGWPYEPAASRPVAVTGR